MIHSRTATALNLAAATVLLAITPIMAAGPPGDAYDLLFVGGRPPVLVRIAIKLDEQDSATAWREAVGKLHAYLDFNHDGTVGREEAERVDWRSLVRLFENRSPETAPQPPADRGTAGAALPFLDARPQDGVVSVEELAEFFRSLRGPLSIQTAPPSPSGADTTFARIDADGDGALAPAERAMAAERLRRFDQNDDESIGIAELAAYRNPFFRFSIAPEQSRAAEPPVVVLDPGGSRIRMVQQLLNRLDTGDGKAKDHRLARDEIGLTAEAFAEFDDDGDGTLDSDELTQFLSRTEPALEIVARLRTAKPGSLEVVRPLPGPAPGAVMKQRVRRPSPDDRSISLELDDVWLEIRPEENANQAVAARGIYDSLFRNLDTDQNEMLSAAEVQRREPFQSLFRLMDQSGDGQLSKAEMHTALALFEDLARGLAMLQVADRGVVLFGNLDTDADGRLGLRELQAASERLATFDRNGDGQVVAFEIPHRFEWTLSRPTITPGFVFPAVKLATSASRRGPATPQAPGWFRKMDRNGDGDLSPREFLGPRAEFRRLDANGDGLIDAGEAR
jgi:Ca2+-binding EF-hand superfamily protein